MNDLDISRALALAIGWNRILPDEVNATAIKQCWVWTGSHWRTFDYRDWSVISPIAEKYNAFPCFFGHANAWIAGAVVGAGYGDGKADTPQKAIALAVIAGAQK